MSMRGWIILAGLIVLISGGGAVVYMAARGLRNNNPGNLRHGAKWQGMSATQTDSAFIQFTAPEFGIRALAKLLLNYQRLYGLNSVRQIITRYAPSSENNTSAYIASVSSAVGASPDAPLDLKRVMPSLVRAIIKHENGMQPYDTATINKGLGMAGVIV